MKISAKMVYGCVAMLELAMHYGSEKPVRIRSIAERHKVPSRFLVQILLEFKEAGFVQSIRGAAGGYKLLLAPSRISLGQIVEVILGEAGKKNKWQIASPDSTVVKVLQQAWGEAGVAQHQILKDISLGDLCARVRSA